MPTGRDGGQVGAGVGRHIRAILLLPVMVTVVIPAFLIRLTGAPRLGWSLPAPWHLLPTLLGCLVIGAGVTLLVWTIRMLATMGQGTLAPWDPTRKLVVSSVYRSVRNPMVSGVLAILLGEALLLGSLPLLGWFALFLTCNLVYTPLVEERALEKRFGEQYVTYREGVPAWIPRIRPWNPESQGANSPGHSQEDGSEHLD
jgi:protein-S-isoprenylcysteine O-methyltransferase Ste14